MASSDVGYRKPTYQDDMSWVSATLSALVAEMMPVIEGLHGLD